MLLLLTSQMAAEIRPALTISLHFTLDFIDALTPHLVVLRSENLSQHAITHLDEAFDVCEGAAVCF
jgi:hypothetical protein